jgi:hypothetical protein
MNRKQLQGRMMAWIVIALYLLRTTFWHELAPHASARAVLSFVCLAGIVAALALEYRGDKEAREER